MHLTRQLDCELSIRNHWLRAVTDLKYQKIEIPMKLPSLNEYVYACRTSFIEGDKFRKRIERDISYYIMLAKVKPVESPCVVHIDWHEADRRRDADNIQSATKFILDALQTSGILQNDSRKYVKQISHNIIKSDSCGAVVWLITGENIKDF